MKREVLVSLVEAKLEELKENGYESYKLYDFCIEVIPEDERQSKHIDILELLLDWGYKLEWKGIRFQPVQREDSRLK